MLIGFTAACTRIFKKAIPALLSMYQLNSVNELHSPLKGEVLFIKGLIRYLSRFPAEVSEQQHHILPLAAAIKLFSLRFSSAASEWLDVLFDSNLKADCFLEERMFDHLIALMVNCAFNRMEQVNLFRNADPHFDGFELFGRALAHRNELLRLQLLHASMAVPPLQQLPHPYTYPTIDYSSVADKLFNHLNAGILNKNIPLTKRAIFAIESDFTAIGRGMFFKRVYQQLETTQTPPWLKDWMLRGMVYLTATLTLPSDSSEGIQDPAILMTLMKHIGTMRSSSVEQWKMGYAAFIFCKAHIFKQGRPEKGLSLMPLFGLSEGQVWLFWQHAVDNMAKASQAMLREQLTQRYQQLHAISLSGPYHFYQQKTEARQLDNPLIPMR